MISVIVPVYNAEGFIAQTLDAVLAQTYADWELVVVNDGSQDNTQAIVESYAARDSRVRVFGRENGGVAAARNAGVAQACPDAAYIIFLDHDDLWEPDALATLLRAMQVTPDVVAAVGGARVLPVGSHSCSASQPPSSQRPSFQRPSSQFSPSQFSPSQFPAFSAFPTKAAPRLLVFEDLLSFCAIWTMGQTLIRRQALEAAGPLDPACVPSDDWDLYLRLLLLGPFAVADNLVIHWRQHGGNTSNDKARMHAAEKRVRAKLLARADLTPAQRSLAIRRFRRPRRNLSAAQFQSARERLAQRQFGEAFTQLRRACLNYVRSLRSEKADAES